MRRRFRGLSFKSRGAVAPMTIRTMSHSPSYGPDMRQIREDLAAAFRLAVRFDLHEGTCNHFTARVGPNRFLLNPEELHRSEITASSL